MYESATPKKLSFFKKISHWYSDNPVLIFSVGKVGSSSISKTLRTINVSEVQPHSLTYSRKGSYFVKPDFTIMEKLFYFIKSKLINLKLFFFKLSKSKKKIKIISLYREPISRNISAFFEQYQYVLEQNIKNYSVDELIDAYWKYTNHDAPVVWFDNELNNAFDINIHDYVFDKDNGYLRIQKGNIDLLLLTMERMDQNEVIIGEFLEVDSFSLTKTNRAERKEYSEIYKEFKETIRIPESYISKLYENKVMDFFYTAETIEKFKSKWVDR